MYMLNVLVTMFLQLMKSVPGTMDEDGICHYMVRLLNNSTTLKQLKQLQNTAQELTSKYEQELSGVSAGVGSWGWE